VKIDSNEKLNAVLSLVTSFRPVVAGVWVNKSSNYASSSVIPNHMCMELRNEERIRELIPWSPVECMRTSNIVCERILPISYSDLIHRNFGVEEALNEVSNKFRLLQQWKADISSNLTGDSQRVSNLQTQLQSLNRTGVDSKDEITTIKNGFRNNNKLIRNNENLIRNNENLIRNNDIETKQLITQMNSTIEQQKQLIQSLQDKLVASEKQNQKIQVDLQNSIQSEANKLKLQIDELTESVGNKNTEIAHNLKTASNERKQLQEKINQVQTFKQRVAQQRAKELENRRKFANNVDSINLEQLQI